MLFFTVCRLRHISQEVYMHERCLYRCRTPPNYSF